MLNGPISQFVPFVPAAPVDGQPELHVLVLALLQICHHLLSSSKAHQCHTGPVSVHQQPQLCSPEHLNDVGKVFPFDVVVCFDENLSQDGLADGIIFGVELVKAVKGVTVLKKMVLKQFDRMITSSPIPCGLHLQRACPGCPRSGQTLSGSYSQTPP